MQGRDAPTIAPPAVPIASPPASVTTASTLPPFSPNAKNGGGGDSSSDMHNSSAINAAQNATLPRVPSGEFVLTSEEEDEEDGDKPPRRRSERTERKSYETLPDCPADLLSEEPKEPKEPTTTPARKSSTVGCNVQ